MLYASHSLLSYCAKSAMASYTIAFGTIGWNHSAYINVFSATYLRMYVALNSEKLGMGGPQNKIVKLL